jgi:MFS family permease
MYLVGLGFSVAQFGFFDGVYGAVGTVTAVIGAVLADTRRRHKQVAGAGYALSAGCKLALLLVGRAWAPLTGVLYVDRMGKGVRTAPRDALISLSSPPDSLGTAFGVHRALDTVGALVGPLLAFCLLWWAPQSYGTVFFVSFLVALIGVTVLVLFVRNADDSRPARARLDIASIGRLARRPECPRIAVAGFCLGSFTVGDSMLYLTLQRQSDVAWRYFPLLSVGTAIAYLVLAVPLGRLADGLGRRRIFLTGFVLLLLTYLLLLTGAHSLAAVVGVLAVLGCYYACTDGVLAAIGSSALPAGSRAAGLAVLAGAVALGRMASSFAYGSIWTSYGARVALGVSSVGLVAAMLVAYRLLRRR